MQISSPLQGLVKGAKFIITSKITNHLRQIKKCTITFFPLTWLVQLASRGCNLENSDDQSKSRFLIIYISIYHTVT